MCIIKDCGIQEETFKFYVFKRSLLVLNINVKESFSLQTEIYAVFNRIPPPFGGW